MTENKRMLFVIVSMFLLLSLVGCKDIVFSGEESPSLMSCYTSSNEKIEFVGMPFEMHRDCISYEPLEESKDPKKHTLKFRAVCNFAGYEINAYEELLNAPCVGVNKLSSDSVEFIYLRNSLEIYPESANDVFEANNWDCAKTETEGKAYCLQDLSECYLVQNDFSCLKYEADNYE